MRELLRVVTLLAALFFALPLAHAVQPDEMLKDPALESRARHLSAQLRCMVCQNQSIDDSDAELARDLRLLVRERISAGDSDRQVLAYLVSRYGEFVLLNPTYSWRNAILWAAPLTVLVAGALALVLRTRRRADAPTPPLSREEKSRISAILSKPD